MLADGAGTTAPAPSARCGSSSPAGRRSSTASSSPSTPPTGTLPADWEQPLAGKVAVVTGAARGIGAAIAAPSPATAPRVVVVDVPAAGDQLAAVANEVRGTALQLDVTADDAGQRILEHAVARHGRLDIVVHNAGITRDKLLANMDPGRWDSVLAVNIAAQLRINEALLASGTSGAHRGSSRSPRPAASPATAARPTTPRPRAA